MSRRPMFAVLALAAATGLTAFTLNARAADDAAMKPMTGTLIDNHCGEKKADEKAAASHKSDCAVKCADSGYQLIVGDKHYKFDDAGNDKAKEYLKDNKDMKVVVDGKMEGDDKIDVTSIKAAPKDEEKKS